MKWTPRLTIIASSVLSAVAGGAVGFVVAQKTLDAKFQERLDAEVQDAKKYYQELYSTPTLSKDDVEETTGPSVILRSTEAEIEVINPELSEELMERRSREARTAFSGYSGDPDGLVSDDRVDRNIFEHHMAPGEEVLESLLAERDPEAPHLITRDEFNQNEGDYEQVAFTYYEGDGILVDDRDEFNPITDTDRVAGDDNLLHFGYGSGDEHVVYIRNPTLNPPMDLHITRSPGKYSVEVAGLDDGPDERPHLKHSQRRFPFDDD